MTHEPDTTPPLSQDRRPFLAPSTRAMLWAAIIVFLTVGYFQNSRPGWNANTQFALTCAIVERGTFSIDAYHQRPDMETDDKAFFQGHYYCDKSPVTAFLGVPVFRLYSSITRGLLGRPLSYDAARYWVNWGVNGCAAALLAAMIAALLLRAGVAPVRAALAAALWIFATPLLAYAILFYNYLPACAMAMGGFLLIERLWNPRNKCGMRNAECGMGEKRENGSRLAGGGGEADEGVRAPSYFQSAFLRCLLAGLLLGLAAWTLNTLALAALILTCGVVLAPAPNHTRRLARLAAWVLGGLIGIAGNFIYTQVVFHSWGSPYAYEADPFFRENMAKGLMGATRPRAMVAWLITFHPFQGLFLWFPLALAALGGAFRLLSRGRRAQKIDSALALAILGGLLTYTSAYFIWWGGWAYISRHLIPALPLLALGLAPWLAARRAPARWALGVLGLAGLTLNLAAVAVNPQHPTGVSPEDLMSLVSVKDWPIPMWELQQIFWQMGYADANWGTALGLHGPLSLLPLLGIWTAGVVMLFRFDANRPTQAAGIDTGAGREPRREDRLKQGQQTTNHKPRATNKKQQATSTKP